MEMYSLTFFKKNDTRIPSFLEEYLKIKMDIKNEVGDRSRGRPEGSLFNSYYTKV